MNSVWSTLPRDVLRSVLLYDGQIVYRDGMYINRIPKDDPRYNMLRNIPCIIPTCFSTSGGYYGLIVRLDATTSIYKQFTGGVGNNPGRLELSPLLDSGHYTYSYAMVYGICYSVYTIKIPPQIPIVLSM
jgi:hypothetical protein